MVSHKCYKADSKYFMGEVVRPKFYQIKRKTYQTLQYANFIKEPKYVGRGMIAFIGKHNRTASASLNKKKRKKKIHYFIVNL